MPYVSSSPLVELVHNTHIDRGWQSFDQCTYHLGPLRQTLFSCLTCNTPPSDPSQPYRPAGVCYSCSISCHGEHNLVELFTKRNFVCDCGTTRMPSTNPCTLRTDPKTKTRGVHSEKPAESNRYCHNFRNQFCECAQPYDPEQEKGTMFQCLGLGSVEEGGCGEDWWHPECLVGLPRNWAEGQSETNVANNLGEEKQEDQCGRGDDNAMLPPGFPEEDDFETFICYKCLNANPWLKKYSGTTGFLPPVYRKTAPTEQTDSQDESTERKEVTLSTVGVEREASSTETSLLGNLPTSESSKKRKFDDTDVSETKRTKEDASEEEAKELSKHVLLPQAPKGIYSLFLKENFREHICHCQSCFPELIPYPQLREEEDTYEPPMSNSDYDQEGSGTGSLFDRGEAVLNNMDRVRAIEGVMAYQHLRDNLKDFFRPFAERGEAVSADDIKAYFERLRGDNEAARLAINSEGSGESQDHRHEQSGKVTVHFFSLES